jgi:hypothetical protein
LQVGDRLLLCGGQYPLRKLQQRLAPSLAMVPITATVRTDVS